MGTSEVNRERPLPKMKQQEEKIEPLHRQVKALREREAHFRSAVVTSLETVITIAQNDRVVFWNLAAEKMFGFTALEITSQPFDRIVPLICVKNIKPP